MNRIRLSAFETWSPAATVSTSMLCLASMLVMFNDATPGSLSMRSVVILNPLASLKDTMLSSALRIAGIVLDSIGITIENSRGDSRHIKNISFLTNMRSTSAVCSMTTSIPRGLGTSTLDVVVLVVRPLIAARFGPYMSRAVLMSPLVTGGSVILSTMSRHCASGGCPMHFMNSIALSADAIWFFVYFMALCSTESTPTQSPSLPRSVCVL